VYLVLVPGSVEGLHRAVSEMHRRYTRAVNFREGWRGRLWQGRFASFVMDEPHLLTAMRHVKLNPLRAGLVERPESYPWSSARAHMLGQDDDLVQVEPMMSMVGDWAAYLALDVDKAESAALHRHERTGRPFWATHSSSSVWKPTSIAFSANANPAPRDQESQSEYSTAFKAVASCCD